MKQKQKVKKKRIQNTFDEKTKGFQNQCNRVVHLNYTSFKYKTNNSSNHHKES